MRTGKISPLVAYQSLSDTDLVQFQGVIAESKFGRRDPDRGFRIEWRFEKFKNSRLEAGEVLTMTQKACFEKIFALEVEAYLASLGQDDETDLGNGQYLLTHDGVVEHTYRRLATSQLKWTINDINDLVNAFMWMVMELAPANARTAAGLTRSVRKAANSAQQQALGIAGKPVHYPRDYTPPRRLPPKGSGKAKEPPPDRVERRTVDTPQGPVERTIKHYAPVTSERPDYVIKKRNDLVNLQARHCDTSDSEAPREHGSYELVPEGSDSEGLFLEALASLGAERVVKLLVAELERPGNEQYDDMLQVCCTVLDDATGLIEATAKRVQWQHPAIAQKLGWDEDRVARVVQEFLRVRDPGRNSVLARFLGGSTYEEATSPTPVGKRSGCLSD